MKTRLLFLVAFFAAFVSASFAGFRVSPETPAFPLPQEVIDLTTPKSLPAELQSVQGKSFADSKELVSRSQKGYAFQVSHALFEKSIMVVNGKLVTDMDGDKPLGPHIYYPDPGKLLGIPIPFKWFEKCGDTLIIGIFPVDGHDPIRITGQGAVRSVRFSDLIDDEGNLRYFTVRLMRDEMRSLRNVKVVASKPNFKDLKGSPLVKMRPINTGPIVTMPEMKVGPKDGNTIIVTDDNGVKTVLAATKQLASADQPYVVDSNGKLITKPAAPSPNNWAKIERIYNADNKVVAALVEHVTPGSPYDLAGLRPGMRIVDSRPEPVDWVDDCHAPAPPPADLLLRVVAVTDCGWELETTLRVDGTEIRKALEPQPTTSPDAPVIAQVEQGAAPANTIGADNIVAAADPRQE